MADTSSSYCVDDTPVGRTEPAFSGRDGREELIAFDAEQSGDTVEVLEAEHALPTHYF